MERTSATGLLVDLLEAIDDAVEKYDPSQPRDGDGKWTDGGGSGSGGGAPEGETLRWRDNINWGSDRPDATVQVRMPDNEAAEVLRRYANSLPDRGRGTQVAGIVARWDANGTWGPEDRFWAHRIANDQQGGTEKRVSADAFAEFAKVDDDQRLVWAWAYVYEDEGQQIVDHSGDVIDAEALADFEKAAYDYVLDSREADEMHVKVTDVAKLVESFFLTPEKAQMFGLVTKRYGWIVGYKVTDEKVWAKIKDRTYTGMSIRGAGDREAIQVAA